MTVRTPLTGPERDALFEVGRAHGLDHIGSCPAREWTSVRGRLEAGRRTGTAATMEFTFRNPARSSDPRRVLRNAASLVVAARGYAQSVDDTLRTVDDDPAGRPQARVARYATADHYGRLREGLGAVAAELRSMGHRAVVVADDNAIVDREAAWRAGIGWYGKNSLLLVPGQGSWFVLGSVVTDVVIAAPAAPVPDGCGGCTRCLDGCPTGAIVAPGVVDARRCLAWLLQAPGTFPVEHRVALGDRIYGCDDCQEVCPPNRTVELRSRRTDPWPVETDPGPHVDVLELLALDDAALLERCARWYVPGRDARVIRRNLLVVLGNSGRGADPDVVECVERHRLSDEPIVAEHATWAAERLRGGGVAHRSRIRQL